MRFCIPLPTTCNPVTSSGCAAGLGCALAGTSDTFCVATGANTLGASCVDARGCAAGSICFESSLGTTCQQYCSLSGGTCPSGQSCQNLGHPDYGVCAP
jgi:hypothetical protein